MQPKSPQNPQPDELPEDQRTGDEPNPSGKAPAAKAPPALTDDQRPSSRRSLPRAIESLDEHLPALDAADRPVNGGRQML